MTKRIIQPNNYSCLAACAAMAAGQDIQDVFDFCGHDGEGRGFSHYEIYAYLIDNGIIPGICLIEVDQRWEFKDVLRNGLDVHLVTRGRPLFVEVESKRMKNVTHVIYWDGYKLYDPSPMADENWTCKDYNILVLTFLTIISDHVRGGDNRNPPIKLIPIDEGESCKQ